MRPKVVASVGALFFAFVVVGFPAHAAAAGARTPSIGTFSIDATFPVATCVGFDVIRHQVADVIVITFFDQNGVPIELTLHITEDNTLSNSVTGKSIETLSILNLAINLTDGTTTATGAPFVLTLRFEGIVIQDTGRLIFDAQGNFVFEAGPHDFGPNGDFSVLCPLLQ